MNETPHAQECFTSTAVVATGKASRYLQQLCKHFSHKAPVAYDTHTGHIAFTGGDCRLKADNDGLRLSVTAPDAAVLEKLQDVAARHLVRFAFREDLHIARQRA